MAFSQLKNPSSTRSMMVLIVEDEYRVAMAMAKLLRNLGYETLIAKNVDAAKNAIDQHQTRIRVVLADYGMRGAETGLDYLKWLEAHQPETIRILISGLDLDVVGMDVYKHCHYYLEKPFNPKGLSDILSYHQHHSGDQSTQVNVSLEQSS